MSIDRRGPRVVLVVGILAGLGQLVLLPRTSPAQVALATDVYHHAAAAALSGGNAYTVTPPAHPGYYFLYPPMILVALLPYGLLSPGIAYAIQTALNLLTTAALAVILLWTIERAGVDLSRLDRALVVGFTFLSVGSVTNLINGQVNPQLALGVAAGVLLLERGREALSGITLAAVATVKLFPALLGAWLLRRRAWRTIIAAVATGVSLFVLGVALLGPDATVSYLTEALPREASTGRFVGGGDPEASQMTIRRQVGFLVPWLPGSALLPVGVIVLAPVVLAAYRRMETLRDRLVALQATWLATLILFPFEPFYLSLALFPTVPLLYVIEGRWSRRLFLVGALVAFAPLSFSTVEMVIGSGVAPEAVTSMALDFSRTAFSFALPPMYGVWLMLGGCVAFQNRGAGSR